MDRYAISAAIATVISCVLGRGLDHARSEWSSPAQTWPAALCRILFLVLLAGMWSAGLVLSVVLLPLPHLLWLKISLVFFALAIPWLITWAALSAQRSRLDQSCGRPLAAQALLFIWLIAEMGGTFLISYIHTSPMRNGWNDISTVLAILMSIGLVSLPTFRREMFRLLTLRARVVIKLTSGRTSGFLFLFICVWSHLKLAACPAGQCQAGGSPGFVWAALYSLAFAWLFAIFLVQYGSIVRWFNEQNREPRPPPAWLRRLVRAVRRVQSA
jgi:hypothetical protein